MIYYTCSKEVIPIKELRKKYGLTQEEIDRILKLKRGTCCRWERRGTTPQYVLDMLNFILKEVR